MLINFLVTAANAQILRQHSRLGILEARGDGGFVPVTIVADTYGLVAIRADANSCGMRQTVVMVVLFDMARR